MTDKVEKIENFEPLQPLDIKFKKPEKLHVCGCNPEKFQLLKRLKKH